MTENQARVILRSHIPNLNAAAIPTKSEVFVLCGRPAADLRDAIEVVLSGRAK